MACAYTLVSGRENGYIHIHRQSLNMLPKDAIVLCVGEFTDITKFLKKVGNRVEGVKATAGEDTKRKMKKDTVKEAILDYLRKMQLDFKEFNLRLPTPEEGFPTAWEHELAFSWITKGIGS